jgi:carbamoyl-phosphate synthase large subunit
MQSTPSPQQKDIGVLIAGIGGGSLGLEINKSLRHAGSYRRIGTDISARAYGFYGDQFDRTYLIQPSEGPAYARKLLEICLSEGVNAIAPGADAVHSIIAEHHDLFEAAGILPMINSRSVIEVCSHKVRSMEFLSNKGIPVPQTLVCSPGRISSFSAFPCIVKPAYSSGASNLVFIAEDEYEANFFASYIQRRGYEAMLQEYVDSAEEFTVGVISAPDGEVISSVALRRFLDSKLSVNMRYDSRIVSSGWSQGCIDDFPEVRVQAERIAKSLGSTWALNVQGRVDRNGKFLPFEINPRHSGTTYLRTLAGLNEPHILLQWHLRDSRAVTSAVTKGYYLRGLAEQRVEWDEVERGR